MDAITFQKLKDVEARLGQVQARMSDQEVATDPTAYQRLARESNDLAPVVERYRAYKDVLAELTKVQEMIKVEAEAELREMAYEELHALEAKRDALEAEIPLLLIPKDPNDEKNVLLEIRAGTGGEEAALFAAEMFRMYTRFAERAGLEDGRRLQDLGRPGRPQGSDRHDRGRPRLLEAALRERRAPRAARARRPRRRAASTPRPSRSRCCPRRKRSTSRSRRRTCASTPSARRAPAGRASTRPTPRSASPTCPPTRSCSCQDEKSQIKNREKAHEGAARAALRGGAGRAAEGDRQRPQEPGRLRRPQREDPHLQLPAVARDRPPHRPHACTSCRTSWTAT